MKYTYIYIYNFVQLPTIMEMLVAESFLRKCSFVAENLYEALA